ncbi:ribonuclease E/G [Brevundimonas balnearis]|uniref:Ribonuclease E/G n=1 Tax=Brevundimonas balnearis TaxID=1572858 RepID=A0ABV6R3H9_9CAUL
MSLVELFLDETPGETRGVLVRDGRCERLVIQREGDIPQHRLGTRCVGRVSEVRAAYGAAFVDLGVGGAPGFLPLGGRSALHEGDSLEVEVVSEPRGSKGPSLRLLGPGQGAPRLLVAGPDVETLLKGWAPGAEIVEGLPAIDAALQAEEEALSTGFAFPDGVDVAVERTRALVAVDIDHAALGGNGGSRARDRANREGLRQAARMIRLRSWGGLVVIDLAGSKLNPERVTQAAREAFDGDGAALGPLSRFGLLQLTIPWTRTPIEERLGERGGRSALTRAIDLTRRLRRALICDTASPRLIARCSPQVAALAASLVARLGPRAGVAADDRAASDHIDIRED